MIYEKVITVEPEKTVDAQDWQRVLNLTVQPKRMIICECDPILLVDAVIEQMPHDKLKTFVDELIYRTKLFF